MGEDYVPNENWCIQKKLLFRPEYSFTEEIVDNAKVFVCTCIVGGDMARSSAPSKKKAKSGAANLMYFKLKDIKEREILVKPLKPKDTVTDGLWAHTDPPTEIQNELREHLVENRTGNPNCRSSKELLKRICHPESPVANKIWPNNIRLVFYQDSADLIELAGGNENSSKRNDSMYRAFLAVDNIKTGQTISLFTGTGSSINEATELAAYRALNYVQFRLGIR